MNNLPAILFFAAMLFIALMVVGLIFARLYTRASKERSFVRTGMGGKKSL